MSFNISATISKTNMTCFNYGNNNPLLLLLPPPPAVAESHQMCGGNQDTRGNLVFTDEQSIAKFISLIQYSRQPIVQPCYVCLHL